MPERLRGLLRELTAPGAGLRPASDADAIGLLELADEGPAGTITAGFASDDEKLAAGGVPALPARAGWLSHKRLWLGLKGTGLTIAALMYGPAFDHLSEEMLGVTAGLWLFPLGWGVIGTWMKNDSPSEPRMHLKSALGAAFSAALIGLGIQGALA